MSSELIEDLEDVRGVEIGLSMQVTGHASLYVGDTVFLLLPNEEGLNAAKRIEDALREWREVIARLQTPV
jgi:hypothetical protein